MISSRSIGAEEARRGREVSGTHRRLRSGDKACFVTLKRSRATLALQWASSFDSNSRRHSQVVRSDPGVCARAAARILFAGRRSMGRLRPFMAWTRSSSPMARTSSLRIFRSRRHDRGRARLRRLEQTQNALRRRPIHRTRGFVARSHARRCEDSRILRFAGMGATRRRHADSRCLRKRRDRCWVHAARDGRHIQRRRVLRSARVRQLEALKVPLVGGVQLPIVRMAKTVQR